MIYKLVTLKLSLISIVRLLFLDGLIVNLNKKAKKPITFLYFVSSFLFTIQYIGLGMISLNLGNGAWGEQTLSVCVKHLKEQS